MKQVVVFISIICSAVIIAAKPITTLPHPIFQPPEHVRILVSVSAPPDYTVPADRLAISFETALARAVQTRFGEPLRTPVVERNENALFTVITVDIRGYNITMNSCSFFIEYRITDAVYDYSDRAIMTYAIDTKTLHGTYAQKKTAACEQTVESFIIDFLNAFFEPPKP